MRTAIPAEKFDHGDPKRFRRGCRCEDCRLGERRRRAKSSLLCATGRSALRNPRPAAAHIQALRAAGMTDGQICAAASICNDVFYRALRGGRIHARNERRILAVPVAAPAVAERPGRSCSDGTGTRRRLQALAVAGWPGAEIARRLGITREYVNFLASRSDGDVQARTATRVRDVYLQLWNRRPEDHGVLPYVARRTRLQAASKGWHPAAVWDDIDSPAEQPQYGERTPRPVAIVEDTAELVQQGWSREVIASRLGVTWDAVRASHSRLGLPMPELTS